MITELFDFYITEEKAEGGPLTKFWMSCLDMVELMIALIRASREGNWHLHMYAVREMIPWCFAYDKHNYARYPSIYMYHAQMNHLPENQPDIYRHMLNSGVSLQSSSTNAFGRVPVDQTVEETINRDTQTAGGTKGFSVNPGAVCKYYLNSEQIVLN